MDRTGTPVVELGRVSVEVAEQLADLLTRAAGRGVTVPAEQEHSEGTRLRRDPDGDN